MKLDNKLVFQYNIDHGRALLQQIQNNLVEDKTAVQKVALIDISDYYAWDVLAFDRTKPGGITDYFKNFLNIAEREDAFKLTKKAISSALDWAIRNQNITDPTQGAASYKKRAISYLSSHEIFNTEDFIDFVLYDEDFERKEIQKESFRNFLIENGLYGQEFRNSRSAITRNTSKNIRETSEGLKLEWEGDESDVNIEIPPTTSSDGLYHIIIKTSRIKIIS